MTDPVRRRKLRPLPGDVPADRAVRPCTWLDALRGWPRELPMDRRLLRRARYETSRTSVREDMNRRFSGRFAAAGRYGIGTILLMLILIQGHEWFGLLFGETLWAMLAYLTLVFTWSALIIHRGMKKYQAPTLRAALRREGVDCCIDCGHLMGRGRPDDTCPECARTHEDFPLEWGPGPVQAPRRSSGGGGGNGASD